MSSSEAWAHYFEKGLNQLADEIRQYPSQEVLWAVQEGIQNSGGTLCVHLLGNLNHFLGAVLGNSGYVRNRPEEFSRRDLSTPELLDAIHETKIRVSGILRALPDIHTPFPDPQIEPPGTIEFQLLRFWGHFQYHLGQINYHRRLTASNQSQ